MTIRFTDETKIEEGLRTIIFIDFVQYVGKNLYRIPASTIEKLNEANIPFEIVDSG